MRARAKTSEVAGGVGSMETGSWEIEAVQSEAIEIAAAVNVGPALAGELRRAGITTLEELRRCGYVEAWRRLHAVAPERDCSHSLLALAGAIAGVRWMQLPAETRAAIVSAAKAEAARR